mgnify:CR=1 FL=1|tara:strand:+ start:14113 stop:14385 length:273 start_codon:yes stop_codon:yes gene_type:complete
MRTIKQLLQVMLDNKDLFNSGLCHWIDQLWFRSKINDDESRLLGKYIRENKPSKFSSIDAWCSRNNHYYWKPGNITPRINWINKHIKLNS